MIFDEPDAILPRLLFHRQHILLFQAVILLIRSSVHCTVKVKEQKLVVHHFCSKAVVFFTSVQQTAHEVK